MPTKREEIILEALSNTYEECKDGKYNSANAGMGGLYVDKCLGDVDVLKTILTIIGDELFEGKNENAKNACLLFDKLYKEGLNNDKFEGHKMNKQFEKIFVPESIRRLNDGCQSDKSEMKNCLMAFSGINQMQTMFAKTEKNPGAEAAPDTRPRR